MVYMSRQAPAICVLLKSRACCTLRFRIEAGVAELCVDEGLLAWCRLPIKEGEKKIEHPFR